MSPLVPQHHLAISLSNLCHFSLSRSHFRSSFIGLSLHYHVIAIFSPLPLLSNILLSLSCTILAILSPSFHHRHHHSLLFIENQGDGFYSVFCYHQVEGSSVFYIVCHACRRALRNVWKFGMVRKVTEDSHNSKLGGDDELCFILYSKFDRYLVTVTVTCYRNRLYL